MNVELPRPSSQRLAVRVTGDALRQVRGGHPWVFDGSIVSVGRDGAPGDLAVIFGDRREFVAIGLWDPDSPIRLRVLHHGAARPIDREFWTERVTAAVSVRAPLNRSTGTTGYRLIHGENDGFGGLVVDRYSSTLVVKCYSAAWFPHLHEVFEAVVAAMSSAGVEVERVVVRFSRNVRDGETYGLADGDVLVGSPVDGPVRFLENGLVFEADVVDGQKTGHFLDQRENRTAVRSLSNSRRVLDVFSSTGGFTLNAAAGGASSVVAVDQSARSIQSAQRNVEANRDRPNIAKCDIDTEVGDAFDVMARRAGDGELFEMVIVDPPSFAHSNRDREPALRAYRRLTQLAVALVTPGGFLVQASCSSRISAAEFRLLVLEEIEATGRSVQVHQRSQHPLDHPVGFAQGAYLKTLFLRLDA